MKGQYVWFVGIIMAPLAGVLLGQGAQVPLSFEVASIKPAPPFSLEKMFSGQIHVGTIRGAEADFQFVSLTDLLAYAYRVKPYQISGPSWMRDGRWDIKGPRKNNFTFLREPRCSSSPAGPCDA
jgi:Protein of unknown function (DUF3738)